MKKITNILKAGAFVLLASLTMSSCTDGNDWGIDSMFDRLFGTTSINVTKDDKLARAEVAWSTTKDTQYYLIEVSTRELNDSVPMGADGSIVFGNDPAHRITASPDTINDLAANTTYYIRIKSVSDDPKKESRWVYADEPFTTVEVEQALNTPTEEDLPEGAGKVRMSWEKGLNVDHFTIAEVGTTDEPVTRNITSEEKAAGEAWLDGLKTFTQYTITIYNGTTARGTQVVMIPGIEISSEISDITSSSAVFSWETSTNVTHYAVVEAGQPKPDASQATALTSDEIAAHKVTLKNLKGSTSYTAYAYINGSLCSTSTFTTKKAKPQGYTEMSFAEAMANWDGLKGKVLVNITGTESNLDQTESIPDGVTHLVFWGEGTNATLTIKKGLGTSETVEKLEFDNLKIIDTGNTTLVYQNDKKGAIKDLELNSCTVTNIRGIVRLNAAAATPMSILLDDCVINGMGSKATSNFYGVLAGDKVVLNSIDVKVSNTTFNSCDGVSASQFFRAKSGQKGSIILENCTFYEMSEKDALFRDTKAMSITVSNVLFAKGGVRPFYGSGAVTSDLAVSGLYHTSDFTFAATDWGKSYTNLEITAGQLFPNATSTSLGKFASDVDASKKVGDQRYK